MTHRFFSFFGKKVNKLGEKIANVYSKFTKLSHEIKMKIIAKFYRVLIKIAFSICHKKLSKKELYFWCQSCTKLCQAFNPKVSEQILIKEEENREMNFIVTYSCQTCQTQDKFYSRTVDFVVDRQIQEAIHRILIKMAFALNHQTLYSHKYYYWCQEHSGFCELGNDDDDDDDNYNYDSYYYDDDSDSDDDDDDYYYDDDDYYDDNNYYDNNYHDDNNDYLYYGRCLR